MLLRPGLVHDRFSACSATAIQHVPSSSAMWQCGGIARASESGTFLLYPTSLPPCMHGALQQRDVANRAANSMFLKNRADETVGFTLRLASSPVSASSPMPTTVSPVPLFQVDLLNPLVFAISIAATMIGYVYHNGKSSTSNQDLGIKVAHSIGTFFGQLTFGWLADHVGRKRMYGVELVR